MKYPKGTKFNRWLLNVEKQRGVARFTIRRWIYLPDGTSKLERLPIHHYKSFRDNPEELKKLILRLNHQVPKEERTKQVVELKHAFIDQVMLDEYKEYLKIQIPTQSKAQNEYHYLYTYFLKFFIADQNIPDPLDWHRVHKTIWTKFLLSNDAPASASVKKQIVAAANRFMLWLHDRRPVEVPPLKFAPLTKSALKAIEATRKLKGEKRQPCFINDEHWAIILTKLTATGGSSPDDETPLRTAEIKPFVLMAYHYGLRRAETLGVQLQDVRKGYLSIERQVSTYCDGKYYFIPLKGRDTRHVPHWFSNATDLHTWAKQAQKHMMHPDTLSDLWKELMDTLKLSYTFHDLRHTFITKAIRGREAREVQLAAGHKNIETTMRYLHDDRTLEDDVFVPEAEASEAS